MVRGKVQLRRVENHVHRQVTFCKRRAGLLKKAKELSVLCEADIGIIIFNGPGKLFELATNGNMQELIRRYANTYGEAHAVIGEASGQPNEMQQEVLLLKKEIDLLQKGMRYMYGETSVGPMTLEELQDLERQLENWACHIRSAKMQAMFQEIQLLENKAGILTAANEFLQGKIIEQNVFFDGVGSLNYPLTIQNSLFHIDSL